MKIVIDIDEATYIKAQAGILGTFGGIIVNGKPYDKVIDEVTELLENEWGYEGMRDDVARIMKGEAE